MTHRAKSETAKGIRMPAVCQSPLIIRGEQRNVLCVREECMGQQSIESKLCSVIRTNLPPRNEIPTVSLKGVVSFDHLLHILSAFEMAEANVVGIPNWSAFSPINASRLAIPPKDHKRSLQSACQQLTVVALAILRSDLCLLLTNSCRRLYPVACYPNDPTEEISDVCLFIQQL